MKVCFWGVRGSTPVPGRSTLRYGGNTACVSVTIGQRLLILDAGSGLRILGQSPLADPPMRADLLLSHLHVDHIMGYRFFRPLFADGTVLRIWSPHRSDGPDTETVLREAMMPPIMPDLASLVRAEITHRGFQPGDTLDLGDGIAVATAALEHPGGSSAYRIAWRGRVFVYATDTGHGDAAVAARLTALCQDADTLVYDAMLTEAEYPSRADWGHSTWEAGARLADAAGVRRLVLFHHAPERDDRAVAAQEAEAAAVRPGTVAAREGLILTVGRPR